MRFIVGIAAIATLLLIVGLFGPTCVLHVTFGDPLVDAFLTYVVPEQMATKQFSLVTTVYHLIVDQKNYLLGMLLATFSALFPASKLATVWFLIADVARRQRTGRDASLTVKFAQRYLEWVGSWSMVDVWLIAIFVAGIEKLPGGSQIEPRWALLAFAASALLSMAASHQLHRLPRCASRPLHNVINKENTMDSKNSNGKRRRRGVFACLVAVVASLVAGCGMFDSVGDSIAKEIANVDRTFQAAIHTIDNGRKGIEDAFERQSHDLQQCLQEMQKNLSVEARDAIDTNVQELASRTTSEFWIGMRVNIAFVEQKLISYLNAVELALRDKLEEIRQEKSLNGKTADSLVAEAIRSAGRLKLDPHVGVPTPTVFQFDYANKYGEADKLVATRKYATFDGFGLAGPEYGLSIRRANNEYEKLPDSANAVTISSDYRVALRAEWLEQHIRAGDQDVRIEADGRPLAAVVIIIGPQPVAPQRRRETRNVDLGSQTLVPVCTRGDKEFKGHGPQVDLQADLSTDGKTLKTRLYMNAVEWKNDKPCGDKTTASGYSAYRVAYTAPPGARIVEIVSPTQSNEKYLDSNCDADSILLPAGELVGAFNCIGDTKGDEAGTRTKVDAHFNRATIVLEWSPGL